jgi:creatinine amidohydrolase
MQSLRLAAVLVLFASWSLTSSSTRGAPQAARGVLLEHLTWQEAERVLTPSTVVVIPMGAQAKEHGPHLRLNNDFVMAEYFARRVLSAADVVVAPTINYGFYPAFVEYPGSTTVPLETARDAVLGIVRTLAGHGPRKFYILNTGVSTVRALTPAADIAAGEGLAVAFFQWSSIADVERTVLQQAEGTHADEGETSMMLYIAPESVDMTKAVKDVHPRNGDGPLRRVEGRPGRYSPSGSYGDPTLATREKGRTLAEAAVRVMLRDIDALRRGTSRTP